MTDTFTTATKRVFWKCPVKGCRTTRVTEQPVPHPGSLVLTDADGKPFGITDGAFAHGSNRAPIRAAWQHNGLVCGDHDALMAGKVLKASYNPEKVCDGRCMNARSGSCDCSCRGENHGRGNVWS